MLNGIERRQNDSNDGGIFTDCKNKNQCGKRRQTLPDQEQTGSSDQVSEIRVSCIQFTKSLGELCYMGKFEKYSLHTQACAHTQMIPNCSKMEASKTIRVHWIIV